MCKSKHELQPIFIAQGTELPLRIPIYFSIGKWPIISIEIKNEDGSTTDAPNITTTKYRDTDGFVEVIYVNADGGESAANDLYVIIHPQNLDICAG